MNKFIKQLSANDSAIKETRAKQLSESVSIEAETLVNKLKKEKLQLQNQMEQLTDLAPEDNTSLRPGSKNFDATKWVTELHTLRMKLALKEIELKEAQAIYTEWFNEK